MKLFSRGARAVPANAATPRARAIAGASLGLWLLALGWLWFAVALVGPTLRTTAPFWVLVNEHDLSAGVVGALLLPIAWLLRARFALCDWERIAHWIERRLLPLCASAFALFAAIAFWVYHRHPLTMDEYGPFTQSRILLAGHTAAWVPPELLGWINASWYYGDFFTVSRASGVWTPTYWPGLALAQLPFAAVGAPWLCNPFWGAVSLWGVHRLTRQLSGSSQAAAWAFVLMLASPVVAINAASFYSMPVHLAFNLIYCLLLLRDDWRGALAAGVLGGWALVLHNPVPHLGFALPWIGFLLWRRRSLLAPLFAGYLVFALPVGFGWSAYLGGFDASHYAQATRAVGGASPFVEMINRLLFTLRPPNFYLLIARLVGLAKTVVWAVPGLIVLAWNGWRGLSNVSWKAGLNQMQIRALKLLAASLFTTFSLYWLVRFDQGHGWGFRYVHSAWFVLPVLGGVWLARAPQSSVLRPFFAALCATSFAVMLPLRAWQVEAFIARQLAQLPAPPAPAASISFINPKYGWFSYDLAQNDPFLRNDDWRLLSHGAPANSRLARRYLVNARRQQSGDWGEIWTGEALCHPTK